MRIFRCSEHDRLFIDSLQPGVKPSHSRSDDDIFTKSIVLKPWGYEYLLASNLDVAVWFLNIKSGRSTSLHCHPKKRTVLIVLEGEVVIESIDIKELHSAGSVIEIEAGAFHRTSNVSGSDAFVLEFETPNDKFDLLRLKDDYGRVGSGYEQVEILQEDLINHDWIRSDGLGALEVVEKFVGDVSLKFFSGDNEKFVGEMLEEFDVLVSMTKGMSIVLGTAIHGVIENANRIQFGGAVLGISWRNTQRPLSYVVANSLVEAGVKDVFASVGDSNGHLIESVARHEALRLRIFMDDRQAGNAAQGLARFGGTPTALLPGSAFGLVSMVPVVLDCWLDSVPLVLVSTSSTLANVLGQDGKLKQSKGSNKSIDGSALFGSLVKLVCRVSANTFDSSQDLSISNAARLAGSTPKGPVLIEVDRSELTRIVSTKQHER